MSWHTSVRGLSLRSGGWRLASGTAETLKSSLLSGRQASSSSRPDKKKLMGSVVLVSKCLAGAGGEMGDGVSGARCPCGSVSAPARDGRERGGCPRCLTWQRLRVGADGVVQDGGSPGLRRRLEAARGGR